MKKLLFGLSILSMLLFGCKATPQKGNSEQTSYSETKEIEKEWHVLEEHQYLIVSYGNFKESYQPSEYQKISYAIYNLSTDIVAAEVSYVQLYGSIEITDFYVGNNVNCVVLRYSYN